MAVRWWADDGPTLNAGLVALFYLRVSGPVLLITPIVCDFSGGWDGVSGPPVLSSGSAHASTVPFIFNLAIDKYSDNLECMLRFACSFTAHKSSL